MDCAASSLQRPHCAKEALLSALDRFGNAGRGAHEPALSASRAVYAARSALAALMNVSPEEISFTSGATESLNLAVSALVRPGDHVITDGTAHNSLLRPLHRKEAEGADLEILMPDEDGEVSTEQWKRAIVPGTKAVFLTHASNVTGRICPVREIAEAAHAAGALVVVDGAQTLGEMPLFLPELGADVFCFAGHKGLMGLQGTGGIFVRRGLEPEPLKVGGSGFDSFSRTHPARMPESLEAGTLPAHGIAVLGACADWLRETGTEAVRAHGLKLTQLFLARIADIPGLTVFAPQADRVPVVSVLVGDMPSSDAAGILWEEYGICVRAGAHCAPLMHRALHTGASGTVRFSFGYFNTQQEIEQAADALRSLAG